MAQQSDSEVRHAKVNDQSVLLKGLIHVGMAAPVLRHGMVWQSVETYNMM
jgi:hypothetical protein